MKSKKEKRTRAFYRVAWNVHHMWEEKGSSDTRLFDEPIISRDYVMAGQSVEGGNYNEHVVPRIMICEECHKMYAQGSSIEEVAVFIEKFLKIVKISKEEQQHLDNKGNLNLKQTMPPNWEFETGDVFHRLEYGNIKFTPIT